MQGGGAGWIKTNRGIAAVVTLLLVYLASSAWAYQELRDGFRLGFFTAVAALAMLGCAVAMMVDRRRMEIDEDIARSGWLDWAVAAGVMALCYLYFELDRLWAHATRDENTWCHQWQPGDLVMWDNRCVLHRRDGFDDAYTRLMHRTQIKGTEAPIAP